MEKWDLEIEEIVDKKWRFFKVLSMMLRWISECICQNTLKTTNNNLKYNEFQ